jgi:hypothetical protein
MSIFFSSERRQALAGIVQACMITQHMLFIGFSLNDTNFVNIASTVKKVRGITHGFALAARGPDNLTHHVLFACRL